MSGTTTLAVRKVFKFLPQKVINHLTDNEVNFVDSKILLKNIEPGKSFSLDENNAVVIKIYDALVREEIILGQGNKVLGEIWGDRSVLVRDCFGEKFNSKVNLRSRYKFTVHYLDRASYHEITRRIPFLHAYFNRLMYISMSISRDYALLKSTLSKEIHLKLTLSKFHLAQQRRGFQIVEMSIEDVCDLSGATRQYLWKTLKPLVDAGVIEINRNNYKVIKEDKLIEGKVLELIHYLSGYYLTKWEME